LLPVGPKIRVAITKPSSADCQARLILASRDVLAGVGIRSIAALPPLTAEIAPADGVVVHRALHRRG
jgi:hypothetical protein